VQAFVRAGASGAVAELVSLLAEDAVLIADGGPEGARFGRVRNVARLITGGRKVTAAQIVPASGTSPETHRPAGG
jgi:hypothetical protein